ncbi:MAG: ATP-dependent zinc metalloprotease FtsH [Firmicutes bacterium ADurb.Bin099]|nr:MAG: ATP-dependent zinc metalloprotease FtsH [Firmicutes bacterium ADurb.Bin099]
MKKYRNISFYVIMFIIAVILISLFTGRDSVKELGYSEFLNQLEKQNVSEVIIRTTTLTVTLKEPIKDGNKVFHVNVENLDKIEDILNEARLSDPDLSYTWKPETTSWWLSLLPSFIILAIVIIVFFVFMNKQAGANNSAMSFGKSRAREYSEKDRKVTFLDVAGADEEKAELEEVVDFLKQPEKYKKLGARIPKGILIVGPPGTGKTLLARAVAGEAGVPFFTISGSDFVEMFVGVGASRVRDLFNQAKAKAPCIIFIDEIDAVGRHRGAGLGGGNDEREQTLNQLLVEMDGFTVDQGIIILAATNRPDILDPALLRPGRFDRRVYVNYPDSKGRYEIMLVHTRNKKLASDVDLHEIAKITPMFTGADIENLMNEAAILAAKRNKDEITMEEVRESIYKVAMGPEKKSRIVSDAERKLTAYHESGHAIAMRTISSTAKVQRVSIIPVGQAGGYTMPIANEDKYFYTKQQLQEEIMTLLGGRAAEAIALGEVSTGASNDLQRANKIARNMIVKYGMSESLANIVFQEEDEVFIGRDYSKVKSYSEGIATKIDQETKRIIDECYDKVKAILTDKRNILDTLAHSLLENERVEADEFEKIYNGENPFEVAILPA